MFRNTMLQYFLCKTISSLPTATKILRSCKVLHVSNFHSSCSKFKEKKPFYNPYIKQYCPDTYTGFIEPHLETVYKKSLLNFEADEPDFERALLKEARRRNRMYRYNKKKSAMNEKKSYPNVFTSDQIQHIQFLHSQDPELWTQAYLAKSFGVEPDISTLLSWCDQGPILKKMIKMVLKKKIKLSDDNHATDDRVNIYKSKAALMPLDESTCVIPSFDIQSTKRRKSDLDDEVKNNPWFKPFDTSHEELELEFAHEEDMKEMMEEESSLDEHFEIFDPEEDLEDEDLENDEENEYDNDDDTIDIDRNESNNSNFDEDKNNENDESEELTIHSDDDVNFYDNKGRFLYKVR